MDEAQEKAVAEGQSLNNLASILFGEASARWYGAAGLETVIGLASALLLFFDLGNTATAVVALAGFLLYIAAFSLRIRAEGQYGHAETLRRQAALSEALAWPVSPLQVTAWRGRAGRRAVRKLEAYERADDYYATTADISPVRLSHMTTESAFYTRHLYGELGRVFGTATGVAIVVSISALSTAFLFGNRAATLSAVVLSTLTVLISAEILGWAIRLRGMKDSIFEIEQDFERMGEAGDHKIEYVMRLVGEYNCIVVCGIPVLRWWFDRHHEHIRKEWDAYIKGSGGLPEY